MTRRVYRFVEKNNNKDFCLVEAILDLHSNACLAVKGSLYEAKEITFLISTKR